MAISLRKQSTPSNPELGRCSLYLDFNGLVRVRSSNGFDTVAMQIGQLALTPTASPSPVSGVIQMYSKLVDGLAELYLLDEAGNDIAVTYGGGKVHGAPSVGWKDDVPGSFYTPGDGITAEFGTSYMCQFYFGEVEFITVTLPPITAESAGLTVSIRDCIADTDDPGCVLFLPDPADNIEGTDPGTPMYSALSRHLSLESDGVSRWNLTHTYYGYNLSEPV